MKCDHTSVGVLIRSLPGELLLIERKKFPFGWAPPAGHLDGDTFEAALVREVKEEVGITIDAYALVLDRKFQNQCRRENGAWHQWRVYRADRWHGELVPAPGETKQAKWVSPFLLKELAESTEEYVRGKVPEANWEKFPGLEPIWLDILKMIRVL